MLRREPRQDHRGERDAEHAERELHQAIGVIEPRDAAGDEERGDQGIEQQAHLRHRGAEDAGQHELADAAHTLGGRLPTRATEQSEACDPRQHEEQLRETRDEHADRERHTGVLRIARDRHREQDHHQVHDHLGERRHREAAVAVEHAAEERHQRYEEKIREGPTQHLDRELVLAGLLGEARRETEDHERRGDDAEHGHADQHGAERAGDAADEFTHLVVAAPYLVLRDHGDEGLRERPLGEQATQEVRDLEGDQERVHQRAGAERLRIDHIAQQSGDAGEESGQSHHRSALEDGAAHEVPAWESAG